MATIDTASSSTELALAFQPAGYEQIPGSTILTRLNYYDGKFLRADDLRLEQNYLRRLAELDARASGSGLVYGFDVSLGRGDALTIGAGLAFDASGRVLYMPAGFTVGLQQLIDSTRRAAVTAQQASAGSSTFAICPPDEGPVQPQGPSGAEFYLITIAHAEETCGEEDVFGTLCDDGCATSTDRAYLVEGVVARATPFLPRTPFVTTTTVGLTDAHIRSQLVSAYFADEKDFVPCQISKAGLLSGLWCNGAAAPSGWEVPIAVVGRLSSSTFVDEWVVRRERMDTPPRRYWQGRMCMRPWDVFLAQVLQFQCQLPSVLSGRGGDATAVDPCAPHVAVIRQVSSYVKELAAALAQPAPTPGAADEQPAPPPASATTATNVEAAYVLALEPLQLETIQKLQVNLADVLAKAALPSQRILIDGGLVELPPAGYLPVTPGTTPPVDEQVRRLMGPGVDLRFCVAAPDYIPRAFESAQHMDRISLVHGLDNPADKPKVDVLVPNGVFDGPKTTPAQGWDATVVLEPRLLEAILGTQHLIVAADVAPNPVELRGFGRSAVLAGGGAEAQFAGQQAQLSVAGAAPPPPFGGYASVEFDKNPFDLSAGDTFTVNAEGALADEIQSPFGDTVTATGTFTVDSRKQPSSGGIQVQATGSLTGSGSTLAGSGDFGPAGVKVQMTFAGNSAELIVASADGGDSQIVVKAEWSGTPLTAEVTATEVRPEAPFEIAKGQFVANANAFSTQNPLRQEALAGLKTIATVLNDSRYTDVVPGKLFNAVAGSTPASRGLTATLDWVLFHRRREKNCSPVVAAPPTTQTYRVFMVSANPEEVDKIVQAVESDQAVTSFAAKQVGLVEFQDASDSLATGAAKVAADWQAVQPGPLIAHATVAVAAGQGDDTLLKTRVAAYQAAVHDVSTPVPDEQIVVHQPQLTHLPSGPDGQILLFTTVAVETVGYQVLAALSDEGAAAIKMLVGSRNVDQFRADPQAHVIGTIAFEAGTSNVASQTLKQLDAQFNNRHMVLRAHVFTQPGQTTTEDVNSQVEMIMKEVGGDTAATFTMKTYEATADTQPAGTNLTCVLEVVG
jgi:hypothetical protein